MIQPNASLKAAGLFAGIGGFELGFSESAIECTFLCEKDPSAGAVLTQRMPGVELHDDISTLVALPNVEVLAAGFPCQNLSLAGMNAGIKGRQSGLVDELFRLIEGTGSQLKWVVLENVPFMLWHKKGEAIQYVTSRLESLGFAWAYRVIDLRAFGLPQRRRRVIIVASRTEDPREVLFDDDFAAREPTDDGEAPCGFSWTEGRLGLGWAVNSVPTLKAGSSIGVVSPPAIWMRDKRMIVTPNIADAERLQGFPANWTNVEVDGQSVRLGNRWRMIGNAIPVQFAKWVGSRLLNPGKYMNGRSTPWAGGVWPNAAWGKKGKIYKMSVSEWPANENLVGLGHFLKFDPSPLSLRATAGFLKRARSSKLRFAPQFLDAVEEHAYNMAPVQLIAAE